LLSQTRPASFGWRACLGAKQLVILTDGVGPRPAPSTLTVRLLAVAGRNGRLRVAGLRESGSQQLPGQLNSLRGVSLLASRAAGMKATKR